MGTIAEKLKYLLDSKKAVKLAIINRYGEVSDETPFREYANRIRNIEISRDCIDNSKMIIDGSVSVLDGIIKIPDVIDLTGVTVLSGAFSDLYNLKEGPKFINTDNITNIGNCYENCESMEKVYQLNTSKVTNARQVFLNCYCLKEIPTLDFSSVININNIFSGCESLENVGGFTNLGKSYTAQSNNYNNYKLDLSASSVITKESVLNIFNSIYDLNLTYDVANGGTLYTQSIILGSGNLTRLALTDEELAIATNKGWTIS